MKAFIQQVLARFHPDRLTRRERIYLMAAGVGVIGMGFYGTFSAVVSYQERMKGLDRLIRQKEAAIATLAQIQREYLLLKKQVGSLDERIEQDHGRFSILSFLESIAGSANVRSKIAYMRPQVGVVTDQYRETSVEMKIENVTLDQSVRFLSAIEEAPHVLRIKNLHFKRRYADPQYLDVTVLVSTYEKAG